MTVLFLLFLAIFFSPITLFSQTILVEAEMGTSYAQYFLRHPLHSVKAVNNEVKFLIEYAPEQKKIIRAEAIAEVRKFNSGNSNRDSHAMEVIEALKYPTVSFKSSEIKIINDDIEVTGLLNFHGQTRGITMKGKIKREGDFLLVNGEFQISLTEFKVKRPTLLFIPTDDILKLYIFAKFKIPE